MGFGWYEHNLQLEISNAIAHMLSFLDHVKKYFPMPLIPPLPFQVMEIGRELKERLQIGGDITIGFENHRDAKGKRGKTYGTTFMYEL